MEGRSVVKYKSYTANEVVLIPPHCVAHRTVDGRQVLALPRVHVVEQPERLAVVLVFAPAKPLVDRIFRLPFGRNGQLLEFPSLGLSPRERSHHDAAPVEERIEGSISAWAESSVSPRRTS